MVDKKPFTEGKKGKYSPVKKKRSSREKTFPLFALWPEGGGRRGSRFFQSPGKKREADNADRTEHRKGRGKSPSLRSGGKKIRKIVSLAFNRGRKRGFWAIWFGPGTVKEGISTIRAKKGEGKGCWPSVSTEWEREAEALGYAFVRLKLPRERKGEKMPTSSL